MSDDHLTVLVKSFANGTSEEALKGFFSRIGNVIQCAIVTAEAAEDGSQPTEARVTFSSAEDVEEAAKMNGADFEGATLSVECLAAPPAAEEPNMIIEDVEGNDLPPQEEEEADEAAQEGEDKATSRGKPVTGVDGRSVVEERKIVVRGLPASVNADRLRELFEPIGTIVDLYNKGRGFAFIGFKTVEESLDALRLDGTEVDGAVLKVEQKRCNASDAASSPECTVVVRGVPENTTVAALQEVLEQTFPAGSVKNIAISARGTVAFVEVESAEVAKQIVKDCATVEGNGMSLTVEGKEEKVCYKCNKPGHLAIRCRASVPAGSCHNCGELGHFARECRRPPTRGGAMSRGGRGGRGMGRGMGRGFGGDRGRGFGGDRGRGFGGDRGGPRRDDRDYRRDDRDYRRDDRDRDGRDYRRDDRDYRRDDRDYRRDDRDRDGKRSRRSHSNDSNDSRRKSHRHHSSSRRRRSDSPDRGYSSRDRRDRH